MRHILTRGGNSIELNALFIQPTRWCGLNCKGCYVKDHDGGEEGFHVAWNELNTLFNAFYRGGHWANQITIALDDLHKEGKKRAHMLFVVDAILMSLLSDNRPKEERPEVHMTAHTVKTVTEYMDELVKGFDSLNMISFSEMSLTPDAVEMYKRFHANGVKINFNHMIPERFDRAVEIPRLRSRLVYADMAYLVMKKSPIGKPRDLLTRIGDRKEMSAVELYKKEVIDKLPDDARLKCVIDGCYRDTARHATTGFGCSSNVSRVQVWPDGSVSGCPYAFTGNTSFGRTAEDIVRNIRTALTEYDFKSRCHLPEDYAHLQRR